MPAKPSLLTAVGLLAGVAALSTSAIFVKLTDAPASALAAYRLLLSALFLLPVVLSARGSLSSLLKLRGRQLGLVLLAGCFLALHYLLWFASLRFTSVVSSTVLVSLQPLFSFLGAYLWFGEKQKRFALAGGLLAIAGSFVIGGSDLGFGGTALLGDALALLAAAAMAGYFLVGQSIQSALPLSAFSFTAYGLSGLLLAGYSLVLGVPLTGYGAWDWSMFLGLAIVPTLIGQSILSGLVRRIGASTVSMAIIGEPVGTAILAYWLLQEAITVQQVTGGMIMLAGIALFMANSPARSRREDRNPAPVSQP
ncbi:membrane protein [Paenibacillus sp. J31TS4]|uniref:DMT family transporter n=1 Tax=Paenibacillus sp. J31TS4 TaxID=2807195 RepID=UPI001B1E8CFE|nr:DMT family transporter [Paenibacillus sp. J31TS4]GIP38405.1 membrane protein [Paenibacillus sp. J31TS4]